MTPLFYIKTESNKENVQPVLLLTMGNGHCSFAITDNVSQQLKQLTYYSCSNNTPYFLNDLLAALPELGVPFYRVLVCYDFPQSTFVPSNKYQYDDAKELLKTMYGLTNNQVIISENITEWQLCNVYAVPAEIHEWMARHFPAATFQHGYSLAIRKMKAASSGSLVIDFRKNEFTLLGIKNNKLLLAQTFPYAVAADVIYYLLKTCHQFSLSQQDIQLTLSGLIDKESDLYKEVTRYFIDVAFADIAWKLPGNIYPDHFFATLNNLAQCVL